MATNIFLGKPSEKIQEFIKNKQKKYYWISKNHIMTPVHKKYLIGFGDNVFWYECETGYDGYVNPILRTETYDDEPGLIFWYLGGIPEENKDWCDPIEATDRSATHLEFNSKETGKTYVFDLVKMEYTPHRTGGIWKIGNDIYQYSKEEDCWTFNGNKIRFNVEEVDVYNRHPDYEWQIIHMGHWMYIKPDSTQIIANHPFKTCPHTQEITFTVDVNTLSANWYES